MDVFDEDETTEYPLSELEDDVGLGLAGEDLALLSDVEVGVRPGLVSDDEQEDRTRSPENLNGIEGGADENAGGNDPTPVEPKKKRPKNPQNILDLQKLKGSRGLLALDDAFKDFKFRGHGHEVEDLDAMLLVYEHWAHRLYPKYKLEDCMKQIEHLGHKKQAYTLMKRYRLGMLTAEDHVELLDDDNKQPEVADVPDDPPIDMFDALVNEADQLMPVVDYTPATAPPALTDEQRERIERNRLAAQQKRLAKLQNVEYQAES